jgi:PTH2 family peptidyl-tRNA hydrolase
MNNTEYKLCPKCNSLSSWDSYFQKYMCNTCQHGFIEEGINKLNENEIVEYFIVNSELNMSTGKIATQVGHVATIIAVEYSNSDNEDFDKWYESDQKKIILRGKQKDLEKLIEQGFYYIRDIGCNEVQPNSLTCVGLPPMPRSEAKKYIKRLQLL